MEKYAWRARIVEGAAEEYKRRHSEIWPEMLEVLKEAGIVNYTIWLSGNELFGYYECEKGIEYAAKLQAESPTVKKWDEYAHRSGRSSSDALLLGNLLRGSAYGGFRYSCHPDKSCGNP